MQFPQVCEVEMLAFGKEGEIRGVNLPLPCEYETVEDYLANVFHLGQNDFQPLPHPSLTAGDVVRVGEDRHLIATIGFQKLTPEQYRKYVSTNQKVRLEARLLLECGADW